MTTDTKNTDMALFSGAQAPSDPGTMRRVIDAGISLAKAEVRLTMPASLRPTLGSKAPTLTGPYDADQLEAISSDPITVTVARLPKQGYETELADALSELAAAMQTQDGALGVGVFSPGSSGGPYQVVARFSDAQSLHQWEHSSDRHQILGTMSHMVDEVAVATAPTPKAFFNALDATSGAHPIRRLLHDALWAIPVSAVVSILISPFVAPLPLSVRILSYVITGTVLTRLLISPARDAVRRWRSRHAPLR
jgi:antibiotic biosynthesis monooxygenase (ABM) superfamily enzyme